jgi:hypothetical protein
VLPVRYELNLYICYVEESRPPLWSEYLATEWSFIMFPVRYELNLYICYVEESKLPLWSIGELLATDPVLWVRFPALPEFVRSSGSGTGSTLPREYN